MSLNLHRCLFVILLLAICCATLTTAQATRKGKCLPFPPFHGSFVSGWQPPVCASLLKQSGYTHYWAYEDQVPNAQNFPDPLTTCANDAIYTFDASPNRLINTFTETQPSTTCQNVLLSVVCFYEIPICDPDVDIDEYVSATTHRPCGWVCEILSKNMSEICSADDLQYLKENNIDLSPQRIEAGLVVQLNCQGGRYTSSNDPESIDGQPQCSAPRFIRSDSVAGRCERYSGSICTGVFGNEYVYVPPGLSQEDLENELNTVSYLLSALPTEDTNTCVADTTRVYCNGMFRGCSYGVKLSDRDPNTGEIIPNTAVPTDIALPLGTPLESCTRYVENCSHTPLFKLYSAVILGGKPLADCDNDSFYHPSLCISSARTGKMTPSTTYSFNSPNFYGKHEYSTFQYDGPYNMVYHGNTFASAEYGIVTNIPYQSTCPSPLIINTIGSQAKTVFGTSSEPARCTFPCPTPIFSQSERDSIEIASWILITFSMAASGLLAITFTVFHSQRHKVLLFWYVITYFFSMLILFIGLLVRSGGSFWESQCQNAQDYQHMTGFGLFQGIVFVFFLTASCAWWLMLAVDLYQRLIRGTFYQRGTKEYKQRLMAMHLFSWICPVFVVVAIVVAHQFGYDQYLPFAFIAFDPKATLNSSLSASIIFFIFILACVLCGLIFIGIIFVYLIRYDPTEGLKKFQDQVDKSKNTWFKAQQILKIFGFILLIIPFIALLIAREGVSGAKADAWSQAKVQWGEALLLGAQGINVFTKLPVGELTDRISVAFIIVTIFAVCSPGIMMFILYFLLSSDIYGLWAGVLAWKLGCTCCARFAKEDTNTGSDASGTSKGSSSGGSSGSAGSARTVGSSDLFSGTQLALTARARDNAITQRAETPAPAHSPVPAATAPQNAEKRGQLFKGFTKPTQDHKKLRRGTSMTPVTPYYDSRDSATGIELGRMSQNSENINSPTSTQGLIGPNTDPTSSGDFDAPADHVNKAQIFHIDEAANENDADDVDNQIDNINDIGRGYDQDGLENTDE
jgi:hypothetical protein